MKFILFSISTATFVFCFHLQSICFYIPSLFSLCVSFKLNGAILDYEYGVSLEDIPSSVYDVALDLARFQYFKETEGLLLFYDKQTFEERSYEFNSSREKQILARLNPWVRKLQGRGRFRIGVI